jgi:PAS domain S-box-containing protein
MKTENKLKILFVEDVPSDKELAEMELRKEGFVFISEVVETKNDFIRALNVFNPDLIISDYSLPSFDGMQALKIAKKFYPAIPFILYTGSMNEETAVECIKAGAWDYIIKEHSARLPFAVKEAMEKKAKLNIIKQSEEKYHTIFEATGTATLIVEEDTTITMANNECFSLTGYSSEELIGTKWTKYVAPESLDLMMKYDKIRRETPEKAPKKYEVNLLNKNGEVRNAILDIGFITETKQRIVSMLDITERKIAEVSLTRSEKELKKAQEITHIGSWYLDLVTNQVEWTEELYKMYGFDPELPPPPYTEHQKLFTPESWDTLSTSLTKTTDTGIPYELELKTIREDGSNGWMWVRGETVQDNEGKTIALWGAAQDISERKNAEEELRKSKQNWEGIFNGLSHPTVILDAQHNVLEINDSLREKLGKEFSEIKKFKCWNIFHEPDTTCPPNGCPFEQMVQTGMAKTTEMEMEAFGGYYLINCTPLFDNKGKLEKVIHIATDITERKTAERILQEIISKNPMSIQIVDKNGYTLSVNSAHTKLFGAVPPPDFTIFNDSQLEKQGFRELFERVKKGEIVHFPDTQFNIHDFNPEYPDVPVWVRGVVFPLMDGNGIPERFVLMQDDITERKKAEEDLYNSHKLLQRIIDLLPVRIFWKDTDLNYLGCNKVFAEDAGMSCSDDLIGKDDYRMGWKEQAESYREDDKRVLKSGESKINFEEIQTTPAGEDIWLKTSKIVLTDLNEKTIGILGTYEDITEQKKMINELIVAKNRAEEMSKVKSNFLANMSHEIRTPLNGILGFTDILKNELTNPEHIQYTNVIEKSGKRLLDTLHLILTFAKLDAEKQDINYSKVQVEDVIEETIQTFKALAKTKKLYLKSVFKTKNINTRTDEKFLLQIMNNLVNNAIKYTSTGGVTVELSKNDQNIIIKIVDTGIGIAKDKHEIIFEEFRQESEGFSRTFEGTGLGLSITKKFVELMKGKIYVESEPGKGSTFIVELPYETIPEPKIIKISSKELFSENSDEINETGDTPTILIVEDDDENRFYIENILNDYKTDSVSDGEGALSRTKAKIYDIVLMDINLGKGIDGITVVKEIRKMDGYKNTPIVALTAYVMDGDKEEFLAAGCTHYLGKPFKRKQLLSIIESIISEK